MTTGTLINKLTELCRAIREIDPDSEAKIRLTKEQFDQLREHYCQTADKSHVWWFQGCKIVVGEISDVF